MEEAEQIWKTVASLADTLEKTRYELDGMRTLFTGVLASLSADTTNRESLARAIAASIEMDVAHTLNSRMKDDALLRREDWMRRLLPQPFWQRVQQIRQQGPQQL